MKIARALHNKAGLMADLPSWTSFFSFLLNKSNQNSNFLDLENTLKDNAFKMIYYSSLIEGNKTPLKTANALFNHALFDGESNIPDYIELLNHKKVYEELISSVMSKRSVDDILKIHSLLLMDVLGIYPNLKRFRVNFGQFVTPDLLKTREALDNIIHIFNSSEANQAKLFLNALNIHLQLFYAHPFEDGNKRTCRLIMNQYLLRNKMKPFIVLKEDKELYFNTLLTYDFTEYYLPFFAEGLSIYLRSDPKITDKIKSLMPSNYDEQEFKQLFLAINNDLDVRSAERLINELASKSETIKSALWLSAYYKLDLGSVFTNSAESEISTVRSLALWGMWKTNPDKYYNILKSHVIADPRPDNKILAFTALTYSEKKFGNDGDFLINLSKIKLEESLAARICEAMAYYNNTKVAKEVIKNILDNSNSDTIKVRAYSSLANFDEANNIIKIFDKFGDSVVSEFVINRLSKNNKINDLIISKKLTEVASKMPRLRKVLLHNLAICQNKPAEGYLNFLDFVLKDNNTDKTEKAYAISIMSKLKDYEWISSNYNFYVEQPKHDLEDIAVFMSYIKSRKGSIQKEVLFNIPNSETVIIEAAEINKMLKENIFGPHFLELYKKGLMR